MTEKDWEIFSKKFYRSAQSDQTLVILATPSYATWLEDNATFIPAVLQNLIPSVKDPSLVKRQISEGSERESRPFEIDIVCACVDGLAPRIDDMAWQRGHLPEEGFSFLHGRSSQIIPDLWTSENSVTSNSPGMQSSLTFTAEHTTTSQVTLPLANTIFRNGRSSTLLVSRWQAQPDGTYHMTRSEEKGNLLLKLFHNAKPGIPSTFIPVIPLTPARKIRSGLGNIVRQIQFDEGIGPASQELETRIDEYLDFTKRSKSTLAVWAIVVPAESLPHRSSGSPNDLLFNGDAVKRLWESPDPNNTMIGHWIDRGAKFCRVRKLYLMQLCLSMLIKR